MKLEGQTLWVQPRLRGVVVTNDSRNPPSRIGEFLPYAAGWRWKVQGRRSVIVPPTAGTRPISGVVLRFESRRELGVATRAMERDLARRVREGQVHFVFHQPGLMSRWSLAAILAAAALALVLAYIYRLPLIAAYTGVLLLNVPLGVSRWRMSAGSVRLMGRAIEVDWRDGRWVSYPFDAVRAVRWSQYAEVIDFADGSSLRLNVRRQARGVYRALVRAVDPGVFASAKGGSGGSLWYWCRVALGAVCVVAVVVRLKVDPPTSLFAEESPLFWAVYVAAIVFTLVYGAMAMIQPAAALERCWRRRRYTGRDAARGRATREIVLIPFEQLT